MNHNKTTEIHLTPRLRSAADWVPQGAHLCDVGTDHAYLPAALTLEKRIVHAIASDIRKGPLERASSTLARYGISSQLVETRLCAGLEGVREGEGDTVTICGMGGEMICGILEQAPWTKENVTLILQPQRSQEELRFWLKEHGYHILKEKVVCEGERWYTLMLAEGGEETVNYSPAEALAGHPSKWVEEEQRLPYLCALLEKQKTLLSNLERSSKAEDSKKNHIKDIMDELTVWIEAMSGKEEHT